MNGNILDISNLTKCYGTHTALDNVSMSIPRGAVFGILGPNGAGKTTLLRIINSILLQDRGEVLMNGKPIGLGKSTPHIGYMPEERGLYPKMRVDEQIMYFGLLKGCDKKVLLHNMQEYMDIFNIADSDRHRKVEELSKGNQQKVQILATVVHDPELIILDEPFSGFDPINGILLTQLIERLKQKECTVMLSSHNMPAVEQMASDIALINRGRIVLSGKLDRLKQQNRTGELSLRIQDELSVANIESLEPVCEVTLLSSSPASGYTYKLAPVHGVDNNALLRQLCDYSPILAFEEVLPTLSDLFITYAGNGATNANVHE